MTSMVYFTLLYIVVFSPVSATAQSYRNVTLGSSIVANKANTTWTSPSGDFAFGFRQVVPGGGYLLAIWFDKIPEKTIVWSANRDNLAQEGSKIDISFDGRFELSDPKGQRIWGRGANLADADVAYGAMLDTGNFVLASNTSAILWKSFDEPTDTILPTQMINKGVGLVSSFSATNYLSGRFRFILQTDGNLLLYTRNFPRDDDIKDYWSPTPQPLGRGYQLTLNQSGYAFLSAENGAVVSMLFSNGASSGRVYQRVVLEYDGVLRYYVYPKSANSSSGRSMAWSVVDFVPNNICTAVRQLTGGGACGFNSLCSMGIDQRPTCKCPAGYTVVDPSDPLSGCKPDFPQQICGQESRDSGLYTFIDMPNTNWIFGDYFYCQSVEEEWCRQACLLDCYCAVAVYSNKQECWKKAYPLTNGRIDSSTGLKALVKVSISASTNSISPTYGSNDSSKNRSALVITGSVLLGSSVLLNLLLLSLVLLLCFGLKIRKSKISQAEGLIQGLNLRSFGLKELEEATDGFKVELGSGACSTVFKGSLKDESGKLVAVKKLDKLPQDADQEFKAEVSSISRTNHRNLVRLLGYCDEGQNRLLVYEFMPNGSLANYLFENNRPDWYRRVQIAFATARGLLYLHEECSTQIIHCDIKPQNVLLDETLMPKISDFGLAKLLRPDQTRTTTGIRGTRGYVAPEWFRNTPITSKVDVYSFGILLLEILCCRRHVEANADNEILADYAYDCYRAGAVHVLVADDEEALADSKCFENLVMVAIWCIQETPSLRPNMKRVMQMLEGSVSVPSPPDPSSFVN